MYYARDYKLEPDYSSIIHYCDECGGEIYEGEVMYNINGDMIHKECLEEYVSEFRCTAKKVGA